MASGVSKPAGAVKLFHQLGMFDTLPKLKPFLEHYLPASILESPSGYRLQQRIREYLQVQFSQRIIGLSRQCFTPSTRKRPFVFIKLVTGTILGLP